MTIEEQFKVKSASFGRKMVKAALKVEGEMHNLVAVDTGALDNSIKTFPLQKTVTGFRIEIGTQGISYAPFVEFGVQNKVYNYHKRKGLDRPIIYSGVGQHFAKRSAENTIEQVFQILRF